MVEDPIHQRLNQYVASGKITPELRDSVLKQLQASKQPTLAQAVADVYVQQHGQTEKYRKFVREAKVRGYWFDATNEDNLRRAGSDLEKYIKEISETTGNNYYDYLMTLTNPGDENEYAAFLFTIPEVRERVIERMGSQEVLYRICNQIIRERKDSDRRKKKKYKHDKKDPKQEYPDDEPEVGIDTRFRPSKEIETVINLMPEGFFRKYKGERAQDPSYPADPDKKGDAGDSGDWSEERSDKKDKVQTLEERMFEEAAESFALILREKARKDCFRFFKDGTPEDAIADLEVFVERQDNKNIKDFYTDQLDVFRRYMSFAQHIEDLGYVNEDFLYPGKGTKAVLPSFHQLIAMYHNLEERRFGVFDDCGTGKTAIAALMKELIQERKTKHNKKVYGRTLVVGPVAGTQAWKDGLQGNETKRYFKDKQNAVFINGDTEDPTMQELQDADFIYVNYEQLTCEREIDGKKQKIFELLRDLGYDHLIVDEVQEVKGEAVVTKSGDMSRSMAVRALAVNHEAENLYLTLLSGTPMPDNLNDYANIYFMLNPEKFAVEKDTENGTELELDFKDLRKRFKAMYEGSPRLLYSMVKRKTVRRTSQEVSDVKQVVPEDVLVDLSDAQKTITDYTFKNRSNWLNQIRYALVDPRLVDPNILKETGLLGKLERKDAAKYMELERLLGDDDGPMAKGEKVVIFSSEFKDGITRDSDRLKQQYVSFGIQEEFGCKENSMEHLVLMFIYEKGMSVNESTIRNKFGKGNTSKEVLAEALDKFEAEGVIIRDGKKLCLKLEEGNKIEEALKMHASLGIRTIDQEISEYLERMQYVNLGIQDEFGTVRGDMDHSILRVLYNAGTVLESELEATVVKDEDSVQDFKKAVEVLESKGYVVREGDEISLELRESNLVGRYVSEYAVLQERRELVSEGLHAEFGSGKNRRLTDTDHSILLQLYNQGDISCKDLEAHFGEHEEDLKKFRTAIQRLEKRGAVVRKDDTISINLREGNLVEAYAARANLDEGLQAHFDSNGFKEYRFNIIDGQTSAGERRAAVRDMKNGLDGVICTAEAGGVSLNFSMASTAIFLDLDYSPATIEQAIARVIRRGQENKDAKVYFLQGKDSLDGDIREYLDNKSQLIQMALDGLGMIESEKNVLWGDETQERLKELYLMRTGGLPIDLSDHEIDNVTSFKTKGVQRRKKKGTDRIVQHKDVYEPTVAQEIREEIMRDSIGCWKKEEFVRKYIDNFEQLGPYLLARAKVTDIVRRSLAGQIDYPGRLLADAAGQGILYSAFHDLEEIVAKIGYKLPHIVDRDFSKPMHEASPNPDKYLADMCGIPRVFDEKFLEEHGRFDFIDNSSITLLPNVDRLRDYMLEANRILEMGGFFQLGIGNWFFAPEFFKGMKKAGFKSIIKSERHDISDELFQHLKDTFGLHYAQAYKAKLSGTTFSLFQKVDDVDSLSSKFFLLENPEYQENKPEEPAVEDEPEPAKVIPLRPAAEVPKVPLPDKSTHRVGGAATKKEKKEYTGKRKLRPGPGGVVVSDD